MVSILIGELLEDEFGISLGVDLCDNLKGPVLDCPALISVVVLMNALPNICIVGIFE
jgi:hypothetical protein